MSVWKRGRALAATKDQVLKAAETAFGVSQSNDDGSIISVPGMSLRFTKNKDNEYIPGWDSDYAGHIRDAMNIDSSTDIGQALINRASTAAMIEKAEDEQRWEAEVQYARDGSVDIRLLDEMS